LSLEGFPRRTSRGHRTIYRIHRSERSAWWFSSDGSGRFDPVSTGEGACYLAEQPLGAWIEVFRKRLLLAEAEVDGRSLFNVELERDLRLADLTSRRALGFGVTASLGADENYEGSQEFAVEAVQAGFDGLRYLLRHDPAQKLYGLALFATAGAPESTDVLWPSGRQGAIPDELLDAARRVFGYRVLPTP
jgi:RES domain-containing protein